MVLNLYDEQFMLVYCLLNCSRKILACYILDSFATLPLSKTISLFSLWDSDFHTSAVSEQYCQKNNLPIKFNIPRHQVSKIGKKIFCLQKSIVCIFSEIMIITICFVQQKIIKYDTSYSPSTLNQICNFLCLESLFLTR